MSSDTATKKGAKAPKKPAEHPKYIEMIKAAIVALKERGGSSRQAILKHIIANYKVGDNAGVHVKTSLKRGVVSGELIQAKGTGASGSFKVAKPVAPKKPATTTTTKAAKPKKKTETKAKKSEKAKPKVGKSKKAAAAKSKAASKKTSAKKGTTTSKTKKTTAKTTKKPKKTTPKKKTPAKKSTKSPKAKSTK